MDGISPRPVDYRQYRRWLLHDPDCTRTAMRCLNENPFPLSAGIPLHVRESPYEADFSDPVGEILLRQRLNTGYPLCVASALAGLPAEDLVRLEMGWALPEKDVTDGVLAALSVYYGFDPLQYFRLIRLADEYRDEAPVDLSLLMGLPLGEKTLALRPKGVRRPDVPPLFRRCPVRVACRRLAGMEIPEAVLWHDGRIFRIEAVFSAQKYARFATGGVGTRFSCRLGGQQRMIGYEEAGQWFVESPRPGAAS